MEVRGISSRAEESIIVSKKKKKKSLEIPPENINPVDFETRFGSLVPWGGDYRVGDTNVTPYGSESPPDADSEEDDPEPEKLDGLAAARDYAVTRVVIPRKPKFTETN